MNAPIPPNTPLPPTVASAPQSTAVRGIVVAGTDAEPLARGQVLEGRVVSQSNNLLVIRTAQGSVTVQTAATPPDGSQVLIRVQTDGARPNVLLLPQTGQPATPANASATAAGQSPAISAALTQGGVVRAVVTAAGIAQQPPGAAGQSISASAPAGTSPAPASGPPLQAGGTAAFRVLGVALPGSTAALSQAAAASAAETVQATVTGHTPGGIVLQTGTAELTLTTPNTVPAGTRLILQLLGVALPEGESAARPGLIADRWDSLREALAALQRGDPALARTTLESMVPTPGPRLAPGMLFFLAAVLSGDLRRLLGDDAVRLLSRSNNALLDRLSGEFSQMQRLATESTGQDWRLFLIPVMTEQGLEQLRFFVRNQPQDGASDDQNPGVRFIIEVAFSRFGAFQFDGLARAKTIDLVVRTHEPLPQAMQHDIRTIYLDTLTALGFGGNLAFQARQAFDTAPVEAAIGPRRDLSV